VKHVILDADNRRPERHIIAVQLTDGENCYDVEEYLRLLVDALSTIFASFGFAKEELLIEMFRQKQCGLNYALGIGFS